MAKIKVCGNGTSGIYPDIREHVGGFERYIELENKIEALLKDNDCEIRLNDPDDYSVRIQLHFKCPTCQADLVETAFDY